MNKGFPIRPTRQGLLFFMTGLLVVATGVLLALPFLALWGLLLLGIGVVAYPLTLRVLLAVRASELSVDCDALTGPSGRLVRGELATATLRCTNAGTMPITPIAWSLVATQGLRLESKRTGLFLAGESTTSWMAEVRAMRVGSAHLHGLELAIGGPLGFFSFTHYRPITRTVSILPRTAASRGRAARSTSRALDAQVDNPHTHPRHGLSSELRELRDHVPGDPFRHVAWKASARQGKLMVKEFESESNRSRIFLLDISPSMRWGGLGQTSLDHAIETTFHLARSATRAQDHIGLITFDREVYGVTRPSIGPKAIRQLLAHLLELHTIVHENHTDTDTDQLSLRVADYVRVHYGRDFRVDVGFPTQSYHAHTSLDEVAMAHFLQTEMSAATERSQAFRVPLATPPSGEFEEATIRAFCQYRGIELPYRSEWVPAQKESGIAASIEKTLSLAGGPHTLHLITNLYGVDDPKRLLQVLNVARSHHHQIRVHCVPDPNPMERPTSGKLEHELESLLEEELRIRRAAVAQALREAGIHVQLPSAKPSPLGRPAKVPVSIPLVR